MASKQMFVWGDDLDAVLAILEEDEQIDHQFTSFINEVSILSIFRMYYVILHFCSYGLSQGWKSL